jgi:hypothetical protein
MAAVEIRNEIVSACIVTGCILLADTYVYTT